MKQCHHSKGQDRLATTVFALLLPLYGLAQSHSAFPVDIIAGPAPQPVMADGRIHLLYELHLSNFAPLPIEIKGIDVFGEGATALASYRGRELKEMVIPIDELSSAESPSDYRGTRVIGE